MAMAKEKLSKTKRLLKDILEDLAANEFRNFKWELKQDDILVGLPRIPWSKLEKADILETVDLMVHTYNQNTLEVTKEVLRKMKKNDLVERLEEEEVSELKEQLKPDLKSLQDKRDKYKEVEETYNEVVQHSKKQLVATERQIRAEFNKLHQFLKEEEEARLTALREEEEQKGKTITREMKIIQEKISSLSDSISAVEEDLKKHNVSFLTSYKPTQTRARAQCSLPDPQLVSGALIDVAKHLGNLSFRVWEKMKRKVNFSPVILDTNTAHCFLYLSDDLTSVRRGDTWQQLPDNPERHTKYAIVLGSEGFSSGKHSWEVEVGDHPVWTVGLAKESGDRKGERSASLEYGIWCLKHRSGEYFDVIGQTVTVKKSLQRIRVQLDYDRGEVSFYNSEDNTHLKTYKDTFTEKLYPYFSVGPAGDAETTDIKVCQAEASL